MIISAARMKLKKKIFHLVPRFGKTQDHLSGHKRYWEKTVENVNIIFLQNDIFSKIVVYEAGAMGHIQLWPIHYNTQKYSVKLN